MCFLSLLKSNVLLPLELISLFSVQQSNILPPYPYTSFFPPHYWYKCLRKDLNYLKLTRMQLNEGINKTAVVQSVDSVV